MSENKILTHPVLERLLKDEIYVNNKNLVMELNSQPFWFFIDHTGISWIYQVIQNGKNHTGLLWVTESLIIKDKLTSSAELLATDYSYLERKWRIPSKSELYNYTQNAKCPARSGVNSRLYSMNFFVVKGGSISLDSFDFYSGDSTGNAIFLTEVNFNNVYDVEWISEKFSTVYSVAQKDINILKKHLFFNNESKFVNKVISRLDYRSVRLPELEQTQWQDPNKGLWEFWGDDDLLLQQLNIKARNPMIDIKRRHVAIDFGTSSTVVAYKDNGRKRLLRIGVRDYNDAPEPHHYENPTVLELIDFKAMLDSWQNQTYRPQLDWDDVRCAHEALYNFRNNSARPEVVSSILTKLKRWALAEAKDFRVQLTDRQGFEHILAPLSTRSYVKGVPLTVSDDDPFDPIELYAWYLGMIINRRNDGLHLHYYMTFPVDYPKEVKEKILSSFKRGLLRSFPESLVKQPPFFEEFLVEERACEPAAYAACALPALKIEPTQEGVAYAVFDFGGGTTDFDFGFYRAATMEEEDDEGVTEVLERFKPNGDRYLGGENILENMAYIVFTENETICRKNEISFTCPPDAIPIPGSELLIDNTQLAMTNMVMLVSLLRNLWEKGVENIAHDYTQKIEFLARNGDKVGNEMTIPIGKLKDYLNNRIGQGVESFMAAISEAFKDAMPKEINILLAGNSSRTSWVQYQFNSIEDDSDNTSPFIEKVHRYFGENHPQFVVHPPLEGDDSDLYKPNAKTGVALGLLNLCPGEPIKLIDKDKTSQQDESPFNFYVGRIYRNCFLSGLNRGAPYHQWHEIGPQREGTFNLCYTQSPLAATGKMEEGAAGLNSRYCRFVGQIEKYRVFARAIKPDTIEIATAKDIDAINTGAFDNLQEIIFG